MGCGICSLYWHLYLGSLLQKMYRTASSMLKNALAAGILLAEIGILAIVGFIPNAYNMIATVMVSFACAMQVQTFRKVGGYSYASTMCIGNLRSGTAALSLYLKR